MSADEVASLEFLISLNLQGNLLSSIPAGLDKKKYLQHLNLAKNRIKDISIPSWPPLLTFLNLNGRFHVYAQVQVYLVDFQFAEILNKNA